MSHFSDPDLLNVNKKHPVRNTTSSTAAQDIDDNFDHISRALQTIKEMLAELQDAMHEDDAEPIIVKPTKTILIHELADARDPWPMFTPGSDFSADDVEDAGYWDPLTDGDETATEFIFADGVCIMTWNAL